MSMNGYLKYLFRNYFEIAAFSFGLLLLALMDPVSAKGPGFCLFELCGITFCPGDGLGHSIAYVFRGDFHNAMQSNILGPLAIIIIGSRIVHLLIQKKNNISNLK